MKKFGTILLVVILAVAIVHRVINHKTTDHKMIELKDAFAVKVTDGPDKYSQSYHIVDSNNQEYVLFGEKVINVKPLFNRFEIGQTYEIKYHTYLFKELPIISEIRISSSNTLKELK